MAANVEAVSGVSDGLKWLGAGLIVAAALGAFYYWPEQSLLLRVVAVVAAVGVAGAIALQTEKGRFAWGVVREARMEVRKVVWPTRKETVQTTLVVVSMVLVLSLFLWLVDWALGAITSVLLGLGD